MIKVTKTIKLLVLFKIDINFQIINRLTNIFILIIYKYLINALIDINEYVSLFSNKLFDSRFVLYYFFHSPLVLTIKSLLLVLPVRLDIRVGLMRDILIGLILLLLLLMHIFLLLLLLLLLRYIFLILLLLLLLLLLRDIILI